MGKYDLIFKFNKLLINVGCLILSILRLPLYLREKQSRSMNIKIKDIPQTEKCYILGLGPSLKRINLSKIDGDTIAVNHFYKFEKDLDYSPTFYCMIDDGFYHEVNGVVNDGFKNAYKQFPNTTFLLNGKYKSLIEKENGTLSNTFFTYMWKGYYNRKDKIDYTKRTHIMSNVVCEAITLAIYAGYKEIILLGCDFNSFASQKSLHCYREDDNERKISLGFELFCYSFVADTYYELEEYAKNHGIEILNATKGSLIDAFKRVDYEERLK